MTGKHPRRAADEPDVLPAWFLAHGAPTLAFEACPYTQALARLAVGLPMPRAAVVVSAHWQTEWGIQVTASRRPATLHDFGGFDPELHEFHYPAPGSRSLAREVVELLVAGGLRAHTDDERGLDHGVWVPLRWIFPAASIPIVQMSLPVPAEPRQLLQIGKLLAPLRAARVLIIGTGGVVHNLGLADLAHDDAPVPLWVRTFDDWLVTCLELGEIEALCEYRRRGPHAERACPTSEHLDPMFVVLGTRLAGDRLRSIYEGFQYGSVSLRSFGISQSGR